MLNVTAKSGAYYEQLLEDLYNTIEGLDVNGYRWSASDSWFRSRAPQLGIPGRHLEFWINLGNIFEVEATHHVHESSVVFACRYIQEQDPKSQGILAAAVADLLHLLARWGRQDGVRTRPTNTRIESTPDHLVVVITFETRIPWRQ